MHQSTNSLKLQAQKAPDFIAEAWPQVRQQAWGDPSFDVASARAIVICGCGDSHHAALSLELAVSEWSSRRVRATHAMEAARYVLSQHTDGTKDTLMVGISASGEVARTLEAIEQASRCGLSTLALTTQGSSSLASAAEHAWVAPMPDLPLGPGLLSYLGSLLMGFALAGLGAEPAQRERIDAAIRELPSILEAWQRAEEAKGQALAYELESNLPVLYLGSGPAFGSALFAAAKAIEATGISAGGQDVEEWAHLEYFCEPSGLPVWMLSSGGRSQTREQEVLEAATAIGRRVIFSSWEGDPNWDALM